jgi:pre-rRNA-processing protein IPI1
MGLKELFSSHTEVIVPNLATVIERSTHLFVDKDPVVRQSVIKLLKVIFTAISEKHVSPFLHMISAYLCCAMTHIYEDIQADSLQILDLLLDHFPGLVVSNSNQILPNFIEQISRSKLDTKRGSSALSINPNLKMASHKWRAKVLTRLHKLLSAILGNTDKTEKVSQDSQLGVKLLTWKKSEISYVQPMPEHFTSRWRQPGFILRYG